MSWTRDQTAARAATELTDGRPACTSKEEVDPDLIHAGKEAVTDLPGAGLAYTGWPLPGSLPG
ncbi:hypothetical protein [Streptomyces albogriseolus]|uniref:hypothetical protein n=1 Tax=Streptomyces albogriseolus TaxID=1887 RepID=UPI003D75E1D3